MIKDLHNNDDHQDGFFSINADQGWQNMAALLDTEMPVKKKRLPWVGVLRTMMAACLLFAVLKTSDKGFRQHDGKGNGLSFLSSQTIVDNTQSTDAVFDATATTPSSTRTNAFTAANDIPNHYSKTTQNQFTLIKNSHAEGITLAVNKSREETESGFDTNGEIAKTEFLDGPEAAIANPIPQAKTVANTGDLKNTVASIKEKDTTTSPSADKKPTKKAGSKSFSLYAGAQLQQGFQPGNTFTAAPYAQAQLNLGKKVFASLGISAYTGNGGAKAMEISDEPVNDVTNNVKSYTTTISHTKLRYVDVPLQVGFKINSHLSVEAGLQASFLVKSQQQKETVAYDFQMTSLGAVDYRQSMVWAPTAIVKRPEAKPHSTDLRYLAGVRYDVGRVTAKLQYQQGFKPVMAPASDNEVRSTKAQTINLQLLYRLWK